MDLLADAMPGTTPYRFGLNNPNYWSDPLGLYEVGPGGRITISDPNEIAMYNAFMQANPGASYDDILSYIMDAANGFVLSLDEVTIIGGGSSGGGGQADLDLEAFLELVVQQALAVHREVAVAIIMQNGRERDKK